MPESEKSFEDRLGRGNDLRNAYPNFSVVFAPPDTSLAYAPLGTFLSALGTANGEVNSLDALYSAEAADRVTLVYTIQKLATEALNYVDSNSAWATVFPKVKMVADKLRGIRPKPPKPPPNPPPGGAPPPRKRNQGDQSYEDIAGHLEKFIAILGKVPGYAPRAALVITAFTGHLSNLRGQNSALSVREQEVSLAKTARSRLYYGTGGLRDKMKAIKKAVRSQYGSGSTEFVAVKGINF